MYMHPFINMCTYANVPSRVHTHQRPHKHSHILTHIRGGAVMAVVFLFLPMLMLGEGGSGWIYMRGWADCCPGAFGVLVLPGRRGARRRGGHLGAAAAPPGAAGDYFVRNTVQRGRPGHAARLQRNAGSECDAPRGAERRAGGMWAGGRHVGGRLAATRAGRSRC